MLLEMDTNNKILVRVKGKHLKDFDMNEPDFQKMLLMLFRSWNTALPDDELMMIAQSLPGQEQPDLLAIDPKGTLYIFEIKAWESQSVNLLQALRYGQIFGQYRYRELDALYKKHVKPASSLREEHRIKFDLSEALSEEAFNHNQVFVILTNGLDFKTREAIQYWKQRNLDVRSWVYRIYSGDQKKMLIELVPFRPEDRPYEDVSEGFYILNTNRKSGTQQDEQDMLKHGKAAAYFPGWKEKICRLEKYDVVFLYASGVGIIAVGKASGTLQECKDLLFRSARLTLPLSGESTLPITKKDNPGRGSSQEQEIYHERGRRAGSASRTTTNAPKRQ
jgi:hypothetical protein